jgi:hypothetical protein
MHGWASELSGIARSALVRLIQNVCEGTRDLLLALGDLRRAKLETEITHFRWGRCVAGIGKEADRGKAKAKDRSPQNRNQEGQ